MSSTITIQSLGSVTESTNILSLTRSQLNFVADLSKPEDNILSALYKVESGLPQFAPEVVTSIRKDKATKAEPADHYTIRLGAIVQQTNDSTGLVEAEGPMSVVIAVNWPQAVPFNVTEAQQALMNAFALWYGSVAAGVPSTDKLTAMSFGRAFVYGPA